MNKAAMEKALGECLKDKGKRKFTQAVELILNFQGIDFGKQQNKQNIEVVLPNGTGKDAKLAIFAEGQLALDAKKEGAEIIAPEDIPRLAADKARLKLLMKTHVFLAQPNLMMVVGKHLGQAMGTRDKLPKPIIGNIKGVADNAKRSVKLKTKGKCLPVLQCSIGTETMEQAKLLENAMAVYDTVATKLGAYSIKSVYVKLTMGKACKV
ncbi:MAG: 50S ribosomal protein L1 [Candidatus Micrarchaeota archaeon]|nr:50S ribosomal protein L1 [Candidatus Micrarchaeota archaeon]